VHHISFATGDGARLIRTLAPNAKVGRVLSINGVEPASDSAEDRQAAAFADAVTKCAFLDPLLHGDYPDAVTPMIEPYVQAGDLDRLRTDQDILGINHYTRSKIAVTPARASQDGATAGGGIGFLPPSPGTPATLMKWEIRSEGIYEIIARVYADYC
jgi:beta-glucosidase